MSQLLKLFNPVAAVMGGKEQAYQDKVLGIESANLIGYWPLSEISGTTADNYEGTAARDGTYARNVTTMGTGTGIGDGNTAPDFNGSGDYVNIYSASLAGAFDATAGTMAIWIKVSAAGVWTDSTLRRPILLLVDGDNFVSIQKQTTNNTVRCGYNAAATLKNVDITTSSTAWQHFAITWDVTGDAVKVYLNGSQSGSTQTGLGEWAGSLNSNQTAIGTYNTTVPSNVWDGYLAHCAIWTTPLGATDILSLAAV